MMYDNSVFHRNINLSNCLILGNNMNESEANIPKSYFGNTQRHNENTPIQIYRKFHLQKLKIF